MTKSATNAAAAAMTMRISGTAAELWAQAKTGAVLELGSHRFNELNGADGVTQYIYGDELGLIDHNGVRSLGEHPGVFKHFGVLGTFVTRGPINGESNPTQGWDDEFLKVNVDGTETSFGVHHFNDWCIGSKSIVFHDGKALWRIIEPGKKISLGDHSYVGSLYMAGDTPVYIRKNMLYAVDDEGTARPIADYKPDLEFQCGIWGVVIKDGDEFFKIFTDGGRRSLGTHECINWNLGSYGIVIDKSLGHRGVADLYWIQNDGTEVHLGEHECNFWECGADGVLLVKEYDEDSTEEFSGMELVIIKEG